MSKIKSSDYKGNPMGYFADKKRELSKAQDGVMTGKEFRAAKKGERRKNKLNKIVQRGEVTTARNTNELNDFTTKTEKRNQFANNFGNAVNNVVDLAVKASPVANTVSNLVAQNTANNNTGNLADVNVNPAAYSPGDVNNYEGGANVAPGMTTTPDTAPAVNVYKPANNTAQSISSINNNSRNPRRQASVKYKKGGPTSKTDMSKVRKNAKK
tara:strand:- start:67 stop:702 length:636 start_codon:yes stop_codon:yes gene_type:complete